MKTQKMIIGRSGHSGAQPLPSSIFGSVRRGQSRVAAGRYPGNGCTWVYSEPVSAAWHDIDIREKFLLEDNMDMTTLLIIVVVLLLFGGGGYYGFRRRG